MAHPIYKGPREKWTYYVGLLSKPSDPEALLPEEQAVLAYLYKHSGVADKLKLNADVQPKASTISGLVSKGILWEHSTKKNVSGALPHGEVQIVVPGIPIPDNPDRVTVVDEASYERSLELMARGPVYISTKHRMYTIKEFDQAAEIVSDQLVQYGYALVEVVKPKAPQPVKTALSTPVPSVTGETTMIKVYDDKTFEKALEMVTRGPVTITAKNLRYTYMTDFDKVAERLVYLLNMGYQPWVDSRHIY